MDNRWKVELESNQSAANRKTYFHRWQTFQYLNIRVSCDSVEQAQIIGAWFNIIRRQFDIEANNISSAWKEESTIKQQKQEEQSGGG